MTKIIGHRGAMGYRPENTMASFLKALTLGADGIEFDVHLTKDHVPVVIHDERVDRTTDAIGEIKDYTFAQLKKLNAGTWFSREYYKERIPSLEEVLNLPVKEDFIFNIELKAGSFYYPGIEEIVLKCIERVGVKSQVVVSSFDHQSLVDIKKIDPSIKTGVLVCSKMFEPWNYVKSINADYYHPDFRSIEPNNVKGLKTHKYGINVYTVNNESVMRAMIHAQVEGIITNYPDMGISVLGYSATRD